MNDVIECRPGRGGRRAFCALLGLLAATLLLGGCATGATKSEDQLVKRAQARWDALVTGDLETAYTYYSPGYRSSVSLIDYGVEMRTRRVQWTSAKYMDHLCEGSRCTVKFDVGYRISRPVPGMDDWNSDTTVEDTWIEVDGKWWYSPQK